MVDEEEKLHPAFPFTGLITGEKRLVGWGMIGTHGPGSRSSLRAADQPKTQDARRAAKVEEHGRRELFLRLVENLSSISNVAIGQS